MTHHAFNVQTINLIGQMIIMVQPHVTKLPNHSQSTIPLLDPFSTAKCISFVFSLHLQTCYKSSEDFRSSTMMKISVSRRPLCSSGRCLPAPPHSPPPSPLASTPLAAWRIWSNSRPFNAQATVKREKPGAPRDGGRWREPGSY